MEASFLQKNQMSQKKIWYLYRLDNTVSPKIRRHFSNEIILKLKVSKNVFYKKCGPKLIFFNEKYNLERFGHFLT